MSGGRNEDLELEAIKAQDRIDQRWLEAREKRLAELPPMNKERAEEYLSLERALAELPEHQAPVGWDAMVRAEAQRLDAAKRVVVAFDASEGSAPRPRIEIAAHRTKTLIAEGSQPRILFEDREEAPATLPAALAATPPTRIYDAVGPRRGRLLAVAGVVALTAALGLWLVTAEQPARVASGRGAAAREPRVAMAEELGELSVKVQRGTPRSAAPRPRSTSAQRQPASVALNPFDEARDGDERVAIRRGDRASAAQLAAADTFVAELVVPGGRRGELRLYHDDGDVVARCASTDRSCSTLANAKLSLRLSAKLRATGSYRVVYLEGEGIAAPSGNLDRDLKACVACRLRMESPVTVE